MAFCQKAENFVLLWSSDFVQTSLAACGKYSYQGIIVFWTSIVSISNGNGNMEELEHEI